MDLLDWGNCIAETLLHDLMWLNRRPEILEEDSEKEFVHWMNEVLECYLKKIWPKSVLKEALKNFFEECEKLKFISGRLFWKK